VGGFDDFGLTRRELLWQAGLWLGPETDPERSGGREDHPQMEMALPDPYAEIPFGDMDAEERMVSEYRMLRFSASLHPLALIRDQLPRGTISSGKLKALPNGSTVRLAGIVVVRQRPQTAKGYVFVLFEDEDGPINVIVKPDIYKRDRTTIRMEPFVAVRGRLQKDGETTNVIAFEVTGLRLASGGRPPSPRRGPTRTEATSEEEMGIVSGAETWAPPPGPGGISEDELFPALPSTQEWWPDRSKLEETGNSPPDREFVGEETGNPPPDRVFIGEETAPGRGVVPGRGVAPGEAEEDSNQQKRQRALEEAATERKREAKNDRTPREGVRGGGVPSEGARDGGALKEEAHPELPKVREWWGKPELAQKGPFAYLTALRQTPPGTKSWG